MESVPTEGHTLFIPLSELIQSLDENSYDIWDQAWMVFDNITHPLIYSHPLTGKPVC